ncbi:MAG: hypothetical protein CME88_15435 [Hirschia sp.]|nr:hypothetical protein [Hirschia sp.]MBF19771.1 hypothetical protein [Hirschia sp.]
MKTFSTRQFCLMSATLFATTVLTPAHAEETGPQSPFAEAVSATKPIFNFRTRLETVEQDGFDEDATALTYRVRAGFETGALFDTKLLVEFDHVDDLVDDFNSTTNGKTNYPVVVDPQVTELNRFQLTNTSLPDTTVTLGRQRIIMDDSRFVGNVGWRQNEQTFDGIRVTNESLGKLKIDVAYVNQANRIFGDDSPAGRWTGDSYLANVSYPTPFGKLTGFAYMIDVEEVTAVSSQTLGARFAGKRELGPGTLDYTVSAAQQSDYGSSNIDYDASYYLLDAGYAINKFSFKAGYEVLGGDDARGFQTPFATLHKFQGWTDKFLGTPATGIEDLYISAGYAPGDLGPLSKVKFGVVYHDFSSETDSIDYGSEIGLVANAKWNVLSFTLKYADYSADAFSTDTQKLWLQFDYSF